MLREGRKIHVDLCVFRSVVPVFLEKWIMAKNLKQGAPGAVKPVAVGEKSGLEVPDLVDAQAIEDGYIERRDGGWVGLVEVRGESFNLLSLEQQDRRIASFAGVLNSFPHLRGGWR